MSLALERSMKARRLLLPLVLLAGACTSAGPFVTSISSDGQGGLVVEKSMVKFNSFTGTVSNHTTTTHKIKLVDLNRLERASQPSSQSAQREVWTGSRD